MAGKLKLKRIKSQNSNLEPQICDLCRTADAEFILVAPRLDGPLVRCINCSLYYVQLPQKESPGQTGQSARVAAEMERLAQRARDLALVEPRVEENETPWRELMAAERLGELKSFISGGRLLEIGSSTGELLAAARSSFEPVGVEADPRNAAIAKSRGLNCFNGALRDAAFPDDHFDAAALYHVIEHFPSPRAELEELRRVIKPGGWLALETPNIASIWFRLLGARWRQFIPDHIFFFTPQTLGRLCEESGFAVRDIRMVGKSMSVRLFINRVGRFNRASGRALNLISENLHLGDRTIRLKLGDVMRIYARKR